MVRYRLRSSAFSLPSSYPSLTHQTPIYSASNDARRILDNEQYCFINARYRRAGRLEGLTSDEMEDSAEDLCSRCASIPWDHLEQKRRATFWMDEKPTLGDFQNSSCRLCRLIAFAILRQTRIYAHAQLVVNLEWQLYYQSQFDYLGEIMLWTVPRCRVGWLGSLILTSNESVREDAIARFSIVPKRIDFATIRSYLERCKASHESCEPETSAQLLDLRVIDCIDNAVVVAPIGCSFVALSYVWGGLSADNYVLGSQIAFPPTIADAVRSTRELGYQYLWVDRYVRRHKYPIELN